MSGRRGKGCIKESFMPASLVRCPYCGAQPHSNCITAGGKSATVSHRERRQLFRQEMKNKPAGGVI